MVYSLSITARLAVAPLIDLTFSDEATLTSRAVTHWLTRKRFDDWGAFMYLHGATRFIYAQAGLRIEPQRSDQVQTSNPRWNHLHALVKTGAVDVETMLYFIRMLLYLGFYSDARQYAYHAMRLPEAREYSLWFAYLSNLADQLAAPLCWDSRMLEIALQKYSRDNLLSFHVALLLGAHLIRLSSNPNAGLHYLRLAEASLESGAVSEGNEDIYKLARARLERHEAAHCLRVGDWISHRKILQRALARLSRAESDHSNDPASLDYLHRETARRICAYGSSAALAVGNLNDALDYAVKAFRLDPTCSSAAMHLGEISFNLGATKSALAFFDRAATTGIIERPFALLRSAECRFETNATDFDVVEAITEQYSNNPQLTASAKRILDRVEDRAHTATITRDWLDGKDSDGTPGDAQMPDSATQIEQMLAGMPLKVNDTQSIIEASEIYHRFSPFWTLQEPLSRGQSPYWAQQPINAWNVRNEQGIPWFKAIYYQSTQGPTIRDRLLWAALGSRRFGLTDIAFGETFISLQDSSPQMKVLLDDWQCADFHSRTLDRTYLARIIGYLGFCNDALRLVPIPWDKSRWSDEDSYLVYTNLWLRYISGLWSGYLDDCEKAFQLMSKGELSLRTRLVLCLQCGGYCGKQRDLERTIAWRERGFSLLKEIERCPSFSSVESQVLASRYWRFASFVPFLRNEKNALLEEAERFESLAREYAGQGLHSRENMYATLETRARIQESLGDITGAMYLLSELARDVDPLDSKVWLNLGDLREKIGDLPGAVRDFIKSARLGPPGREIAWYRAGMCLEVLGEISEAIRCHIRSLSSYPLGKSPLLEIARLSQLAGDRYLFAWACERLEQSSENSELQRDLEN